MSARTRISELADKAVHAPSTFVGSTPAPGVLKRALAVHFNVFSNSRCAVAQTSQSAVSQVPKPAR